MTTGHIARMWLIPTLLGMFVTFNNTPPSIFGHQLVTPGVASQQLAMGWYDNPTSSLSARADGCSSTGVTTGAPELGARCGGIASGCHIQEVNGTDREYEIQTCGKSSNKKCVSHAPGGCAETMFNKIRAHQRQCMDADGQPCGNNPPFWVITSVLRSGVASGYDCTGHKCGNASITLPTGTVIITGNGTIIVGDPSTPVGPGSEPIKIPAPPR